VKDKSAENRQDIQIMYSSLLKDFIWKKFEKNNFDELFVTPMTV